MLLQLNSNTTRCPRDPKHAGGGIGIGHSERSTGGPAACMCATPLIETHRTLPSGPRAVSFKS